MSSFHRSVFGLIPAAGTASRLGTLSCSKEILPLLPNDTGEMQPACASLLESFAHADIATAFCLLRQGKWDIPATLGTGSDYGVNLAYLAFGATANVPETLDKAYPFVAQGIVALGFPDILFEPRHAYRSLLRRYRASEDQGRQVILGLFPTKQSWKADMVEVDSRDRVRQLVIKEPDTDLDYTWSIAVWGPDFTAFLHDRVAHTRDQPRATELYVGDVIQDAIDDGFDVKAERFDHGSFLDIGTPGDLERATARSRR